MYIHNVYADRALVDMTAAQSVDFETIKLKLTLAVIYEISQTDPSTCIFISVAAY